MLDYKFLGIPRSPAGVAVKDILTFGIYGKFWLYRINREMDGHHGFHLNLPLLGILVALPIVTPLGVKWNTFKRLNIMAGDNPTIRIIPHGWLWLVSLVPVLGTAFYTAWVQASLNRYWFWHKRDERIRIKTEKVREIAPATGENEALHAKRATLEAEIDSLEMERAEDMKIAEMKAAEREKRAGLVGLVWKGYPQWRAKRKLAQAERRRRRKAEAAEVAAQKRARKETKRKAEGALAGLTPKERKARKARLRREAKEAKAAAKAAKARGGDEGEPPVEPAAAQEKPQGLLAKARFRKPATTGMEGPEPAAGEAPVANGDPDAAHAQAAAEAGRATRADDGTSSKRDLRRQAKQERQLAREEAKRARERQKLIDKGLLTVVSLQCPSCHGIIESVDRVEGEKTKVECANCGASGTI